MSTVRSDVKQQHPEGRHVVPMQEHWGTRGHQAHLDVTEHLDPNVLIAVEFDVSSDGGQTWTHGGGFTKRGGESTIDKNGDPLHFVTASFGHEPTPRHQDYRGVWVGSDPCQRRLVRGTMTVTGGAVTTRLHYAGTATAGIDKSLVPVYAAVDVPPAFAEKWAAERAAAGEHG